jgi:hypothetical protein
MMQPTGAMPLMPTRRFWRGFIVPQNLRCK